MPDWERAPPRQPVKSKSEDAADVLEDPMDLDGPSVQQSGHSLTVRTAPCITSNAVHAMDSMRLVLSLLLPGRASYLPGRKMA